MNDETTVIEQVGVDTTGVAQILGELQAYCRRKGIALVSMPECLALCAIAGPGAGILLAKVYEIKPETVKFQRVGFGPETKVGMG